MPGVKDKFAPLNAMPIETFNLEDLIPTIPRWSFEGDGRPFVLFIDEANELSALAAADHQVRVSFS